MKDQQNWILKSRIENWKMKIDDYNHDFEKDSKRPTEIVFI